MRIRAGAALHVALLLLLLAVTLPGHAQPAGPRIGLVTMQPGQEYWSRFGHNAILVEEPGGARTLYNYGYFDFDQPGFLLRFLRGRMLYRLVALPAHADLGYYAAEGRGVGLQWLAVPPQAARELADFLVWNTRPENAEYRYDYFSDNCSTRVRDALDSALGGALRRQLESRSRGLTWRSESRRLAAPLAWLYLGIDFGLGPVVDRPISRWSEGFVPMRLAEAVREVQLPDGTALVRRELELVPHRLEPVREVPPRLGGLFLAAGVLLAAAMALLPRRGATIVLAGWWSLAGIGGLALAALWAFTDHQAAWANANLMLADPLCLVLLAALPALWRGRAAAPWLRGLGLLAAAVAIGSLLLQALPLSTQSNGDWIALMLPLHLAAGWRLWQSGAR
ncbi:MAG TPA: DUF4105 domain-containing protein [Xanthomonadaceae bacterium]|nr:DUF4105 domain-containing protein [Xanthomonadaceae bacterium]